jgi:hypothetical protein
MMLKQHQRLVAGSTPARPVAVQVGMMLIGLIHILLLAISTLSDLSRCCGCAEGSAGARCSDKGSRRSYGNWHRGIH